MQTRSKKKYRVSVSYVFEAHDDADARKHLAFLALDPEANIKLQELYDHKPPRNIILAKKINTT